MLNYARFLTPVAKAREPSPIRALQPLMAIPGMISLGGGLPNPTTFPFASIDVTLDSGDKVHLQGPELAASLQYTLTAGFPQMTDWINSYISRFHRPQYRDWTTCVTTGSQDALTKAFDMLLTDKDCMIVDNPTYPGALSSLKPIGCRLVGIETDDFGMIPEELEKNLQLLRNENVLPKAIYTTPIGQNPAGTTLPLARKQKIYEICSRYDILILEDDPYYFLVLEEQDKDPLFPFASNTQLCSPPASFMSMDVDGRVLRFDSLSKVLSSGIRIGWVSGPKPLVERINLHMQANELHTCSLSQCITAALLRQWGDDGLSNHIARIQGLYRSRRDAFFKSLDTHLSGLVHCAKPVAGMFAWMRLNGIEDSSSLIQNEARERKVLAVPGSAFLPDPSRKSSWVRASFSIASDGDMDEALRRLAECVKLAQNVQQ
ncbi:mitochondrial lysine biosynthesis alpha-ketoadipate glutamate aminotransferase [Andalucia godoyi]|uniref:Mitochondrial lysine biosynthesis alpha-ketoadipate glutamate aminotransferase n=1 Tax=Andalucia godoyi TaxID=505711 RepID=A0A8K0AHS8_ANDGO|nr:mitochondrial lysine biosynthesis alpha-ketoadipate glutamate aminotransferase [Andalucia godoyi]|eukprot:ANDGO_02279.mRNA.1 mitochondrial lysine biosynthesis alpha-ketoadipate glutamate aminotransferase (kynurenine/alpha-aminoadipate aminotransferase) (Aro8)